MAGVSFKVPKSPQKDILKIDEFLGVDLTNTGINMDERRSPNAINMVRNVPGKVRKRTGYKKDIQFANDIWGINLCVNGTKEKTVVIDYIHAGKWVKIYDFAKDIGGTNDAAVYIFFEYHATEYFKLGNYQINRQFTYANYQGSALFELTDYQEFDGIYIYSEEPQTITFKKFFATGEDHYVPREADIEWSTPNHLVECDSKNPVIYGTHIAKLTNRNELYHPDPSIINVNRVANSDPHKRFTIYNSNPYTLFSLEEHIPVGTKYIVDFQFSMKVEYQGVTPSTRKKAKLSICGNDFYLYETDDDTAAFINKTFESKDFDAGDITVTVEDMTNVSSVTFNFYDFTVMYAWDGTEYPYHDTPATFDLSKLYTYNEKNYASRQTGRVIAPGDIDIGIDQYGYEGVEYLAHISFDYWISMYNSDTSESKTRTFTLKLETSTYDVVWESDPITLTVEANQSPYVHKAVQTKGTQDVYVSYENGYLKKLRVTFTPSISDSSLVCSLEVNNVKINKLETKYTYISSQKWYLYHVGKEFFIRASDTDDFIQAYTDANEHVSRAWQFEKNLYIIDGKDMYIYEVAQTTLSPISGDKAYIPTVTIAKEAEGGGQQYEALNMLQPGFYELFQSDGTSVLYNLSFGNLDGTTVKVWLLGQDAEWEELEEGVNFSVDRVTGGIHFNTAPPVSPLTGEDNIKVLAYRTVEGYRDRVTKCTTGTLFGVGGAEDRLFLSGNPDYPNWDFFSGQYDPTYFPDTGYSTLGSEQSAIVGYAVINNYLATFKDGYDTSQVVFIREGDLIVNEDTHLSDPAFKLINTLQGNGVISPYTFGYLQTEPIFLTKSGLYAITSQDITGEKYSQNRSFYLDGQLLKENGLENAVAVVFKDQYYLCINNKMYILDGMQATRTDRAEPYATRQYAGFLCNNIPAVTIWTDDKLLSFGTKDGKVCYFFNDVDDPNSYNDDGQAIYACWETPDLDGKLFYKNKTFRYFAVRIMRAVYTSAKIFGERLGVWSFIKEQTVIGKAFNFNSVDFTRFTFSVDESERLLHSKLRVKKVDKARFRIENGELNEPFGIFDLALEYVESGNYKR